MCRGLDSISRKAHTILGKNSAQKIHYFTIKNAKSNFSFSIQVVWASPFRMINLFGPGHVGHSFFF